MHPADAQTDTIPVQRGQLIRYTNFPSVHIQPRNVDVWLPENYSDKKKYAVLYMQDGQALFDTLWFRIKAGKAEWMVDENMQALQDSMRLRDCIVVGTWNTTNRRPEYFPQKAFEMLDTALQSKVKADIKGQPVSDAYLKFLVTELKPFIDSTYAVLNTIEDTYIAGSSMGGLISLYAMCEYPEVYGGAACFSTHWVGCPTLRNDAIPKSFIAYLTKNLPSADDHKIYFDRGTEGLDALYAPWQVQADDLLKKKGYMKKQRGFTKVFYGDDHNEHYWQKRIGGALLFLLGTTNKEH